MEDHRKTIQSLGLRIDWVVVLKKLEPSYYNGNTLLLTTYTYDGNLNLSSLRAAQIEFAADRGAKMLRRQHRLGFRV